MTAIGVMSKCVREEQRWGTEQSVCTSLSVLCTCQMSTALDGVEEQSTNTSHSTSMSKLWARNGVEGEWQESVPFFSHISIFCRFAPTPETFQFPSQKSQSAEQVVVDGGWRSSAARQGNDAVPLSCTSPHHSLQISQSSPAQQCTLKSSFRRRSIYILLLSCISPSCSKNPCSML